MGRRRRADGIYYFDRILFVKCIFVSGTIRCVTWPLCHNADMHPALTSPPRLSFNREGRCGTTDYFTTSFLHFSLFSTVLWDLANYRAVHSLMFSSYLFYCLPCLHPPFTVPCKMVLARPEERETWPYHCSLRLFTMVRSSCGPIACWILARTSLLVTWSLYEMLIILR